MPNLISKIWLNSTSLFDPIQYLFNGTFWKEFLDQFGSDTRGSIVDLACGTGELVRHIHPKDYLGIDINARYIDFANKRLHTPNIHFQVGDILRQKINNEVDTVFFISAAHHLDDSQIISLARSLKSVRVKKFILVDGYPIGLFSKPLAFLDDKLGGGKYFRNARELAILFRPYLKIINSGEFSARASFYHYPFLVATAISP